MLIGPSYDPTTTALLQELEAQLTRSQLTRALRTRQANGSNARPMAPTRAESSDERGEKSGRDRHDDSGPWPGFRV
jgi:hypothetical protein